MYGDHELKISRLVVGRLGGEVDKDLPEDCRRIVRDLVRLGRIP